MDARALKIEAARVALGHVRDGARLGIGTGSTAEEFVRLLAEKVAAGMKVIGVPTSERTAALCRELGVPLSTLDETPELDLTIDGADEADRDLNLIKGGGGMLLREKIVAASSKSMLVIADESKLVARLGKFPLPIEVIAFGHKSTAARLQAAFAALGYADVPMTLRHKDGECFMTDSGCVIYDCAFGQIADAPKLATAIQAVPGVVEHGLFIGIAKTLLIASPGEVEVIR